MLAREMKRILTALVLIPVVIGMVFWAPLWLFTLGCCAVALLALWEYLALADAMGARTPRITTCVLAALLFFCAFHFPDLLAPAMFAMALFLLGMGIFRSPLDRLLPDTASAYFGLIYVGMSMVTLPLLIQKPDGPSLLLFLFFAVWSGDIAALYIGKRFGRHKMAPRLSPGKTWEGAAASLGASALSAVFLMWLAAFLTNHSVFGLSYAGPWFYWVILAIVLNAAAQLGDLVESGLKRGAGVKDSGKLLPGHGGVLDRIDALLLAASLLWFIQIAQQSF